MNMYHHLCIGKKILASNLPKKYESLAQSCNVESEAFWYEPHDVTIHHGKISQEEVEIYLLSDNGDTSNEVFKIYQNIYVSILPNFISCWENDYQAKVLIHDISHLVAGISMNCHRYEELYRADYQTSKQINDYQKNLNDIQKLSFLMRILINDYNLLYRDTRRLFNFNNIDVHRLLFSTMNLFENDLSRLNIKLNIPHQHQHDIWSNELAISSILTKIFQNILDFDYRILPESELFISTINKIQYFEIIIEMTIREDVVQIYKEDINEHSQTNIVFREYDSMKKMIKLIKGNFQFKLLGQTIKYESSHRHRALYDENYNNYERCQIVISLPNNKK